MSKSFSQRQITGLPVGIVVPSPWYNPKIKASSGICLGPNTPLLHWMATLSPTFRFKASTPVVSTGYELVRTTTLWSSVTVCVIPFSSVILSMGARSWINFMDVAFWLVMPSVTTSPSSFWRRYSSSAVKRPILVGTRWSPARHKFELLILRPLSFCAWGSCRLASSMKNR